MEIVLLVVIGLIAKNFKSILEFLAEQGQQYGTPPIVKNPGGQPNLSKKAPTDFNYGEDYYSDEEYNDYEPKVYKAKNSKTELKNQTKENNQLNNYLENTTKNKNSNLEASGKHQTNSQEKTISKEYTEENLIQLDDLKKGVIWQEILEPPRARRPYRKII